MTITGTVWEMFGLNSCDLKWRTKMPKLLIYIATALLFFVTNACQMNAPETPRLNKENFGDYLRALEDGDFEALATRFYSEDFTISIGEETLDLEAFLDFERSLIPIMDFTFVVNQIVSDETGIAMDAFENITVLQDSDNPLIGPALEGERWQMHINVFYVLTEGRISNISVNTLSMEKVGAF